MHNRFRPLLLYVCIAMFGFLAFVQTTFFPLFFYYANVIILVGLLLCVNLYYRVKVDKALVGYLFFFLFSFLIGLYSYPISMVVEGDRFKYSELSLYGRLFNLLSLSVLIVLVDAFHGRRKTSDCERFFVAKWYSLGVFFLLLIGVWQLISFYFPISFPFETRSHLHSTYGYSYTLTQRLTSISREPSYFVMFAVDFVGLACLFCKGLRRTAMVILGTVMVIFSLSPSGFIVFSGAFFGAWIFSELKFINIRLKPKRVGFSLVMMGIVIIFFNVNDQILAYVVNRILEASPDNSKRLYMSVMPIYWSIDGSLFNFLFGYGMKSYSIIGSYYSLPSGEAVHATSNNIFTDVFWESGVVGVVTLLTFFVYVFLRIFRSRMDKHTSFVAYYLIIDLLLSGMFRADFASARYFILLYVLYLLIKPSSKIIVNERLNCSA